MPDETLKLMMAGAIRTLFDPIGLVTNSTMELANWDAKSSVSSSNPSTGDEDPQTPTTSTSTNLLSQALEKLTIPKPKIKWNLWRVVNSSFSECHCVDLVTYSQPSSNVMKVLKQLPPSKSRPGTGYAIFRDGICPRREDPALKNGGSFAHFHENIHKKSQMEFAVDTVDQFWHRLLKVTLVSAPPEILNEVQGVVVYAISKSNRRASLTDADISARRFHVRGEKEKAPAFKMEIWIKNAENAELFESCVLNRFGSVPIV